MNSQSIATPIPISSHSEIKKAVPLTGSYLAETELHKRMERVNHNRYTKTDRIMPQGIMHLIVLLLLSSPNNIVFPTIES